MTTWSVRVGGIGSSTDIGAAVRECRAPLVLIGALCAFVNMVMRTGLLFMLQFCERVLTSRLEAALAARFAFLLVLLPLHRPLGGPMEM